MVSSCGWRALRVAALITSAWLAAGPAAADAGDTATEPPPNAAPSAAALPTEQPGEPPMSPFEQNAARAFDVFPIRVLSACATVVGLGAFVVSVPLIAPFGHLEAVRNSWEYFVVGPADYTFVRPLGDF